MKKVCTMSVYIAGFILISSCKTNYPNVTDVPDYKPPTFSKEDVQLELAELQKERDAARALLPQEPHS